LRALLHKVRQTRWANLFIVILRILLGYAFIPAGLKKVLDEPFTDPTKTGAFHEFLHAFYATGWFYQFVGVMQLTVGILLMTQTFGTLGAAMALPIFAAITAFCWSTNAIFTAWMVTLMLLGTLVLVAWDFEKWRGILNVGPLDSPGPEATIPPVDIGLWRLCGIAILVLYFGICLYSGGIYRPKGVDLDNPAFYTFPLIATFPFITIAIEIRRRRRSSAG
jgi:uncharacterized membrane protein YphA (DoxX/SURF4 family)